MVSRGKCFCAAVQCIGGTTALWVILLILLYVTGDAVAWYFWLMPVPGLVLLPLMALVGKGVFGCRYGLAFRHTAKAYGYGALLGIAIMALAMLLYEAAASIGDWYRYVTCC